MQAQVASGLPGGTAAFAMTGELVPFVNGEHACAGEQAETLRGGADCSGRTVSLNSNCV